MLSPWGYGAKRAMYPDNLNGPFGSPGHPIPAYSLGPAYNGPLPYKGEGVIAIEYGKRACSFGSSGSPTHLLTPAGVSTENSWGLLRMGKKSKKKRRRSKNNRKRRRRSKSNRKSLCRPKFGRRSVRKKNVKYSRRRKR